MLKTMFFLYFPNPMPLSPPAGEAATSRTHLGLNLCDFRVGHKDQDCLNFWASNSLITPEACSCLHPGYVVVRPMASNRSYYTEGTDHPVRQWLQQQVVLRSRPEWGTGKVLRWYPATGGQPPRLRVMFANVNAPQVVGVNEVEKVTS